MRTRPRVFGTLLMLVVMSAGITAVRAQAPDFTGTWSLQGLTRLKVKKVGKFAQPSTGKIQFGDNGRFVLVLDDLFTLSGDYECKGPRCALDPDPDSLESALLSLLQVSLFQFAFRELQTGKAKFKVRRRNKRNTELVKVRLSIQFKALLALADPSDPGAELARPFRMKLRFKGESQGS